MAMVCILVRLHRCTADGFVVENVACALASVRFVQPNWCGGRFVYAMQSKSESHHHPHILLVAVLCLYYRRRSVCGYVGLL